MQAQAAPREAPQLRVPQWIDPSGAPLQAPLRLDDLGQGWKILFAFQHWCPGCHSLGFPTLKLLFDALHGQGVGFAAIQTVFEGEAENTFDKLGENQRRYALPIAFGHDPIAAGQRYSSFMQDYRSGGTPWFTLIEPGGRIVYADFRLDPQRLIELLRSDGGAAAR